MEFDQESEENLASENMELDNEAIDSETEYDEEKMSKQIVMRRIAIKREILYEGGYPDPLDISKQWFFSDSIPEEPDTSSYPPGPEATILKEIKQHQKIVEAYKRDLQLSLYLQEHGLKLVKQDSVIAGPDEVVISKPALNQLKRDLKTMGKEFRGKLEQNAELEKRIEQLEQEKKRSQEAREQQRTEIRDLSERLIERIKNL
ncbi:hypothetical protein B9Z19DRAFT_1069924 [Tuber borchii]|uniref:Uncharacterized protein n=1 Tax=Tuber borchii TaxID=42251 RepID=A0A2T6Z9X0_TUBBO|nr:hypothetical protein B9Z19DRAFT_1069924 [Tuber borchii]